MTKPKPGDRVTVTDDDGREMTGTVKAQAGEDSFAVAPDGGGAAVWRAARRMSVRPGMPDVEKMLERLALPLRARDPSAMATDVLDSRGDVVLYDVEADDAAGLIALVNAAPAMLRAIKGARLALAEVPE